jgi:D-3-phosphoglycerate dehydrogenase / 2-oxoglutarate reductase
MRENSYLIVDFDSTFVKLEALEEIARCALEKNPNKEKIQEEIENITQQGMRGEVSFGDSLKKRLALFSANKDDIDQVSIKIKENITESFLENKDFFQKNGKNIFIVSGGFQDCIYPVTDDFKIPRENVLANEFKFNSEGDVLGINQEKLASKTQGKVRQIENLKLKGLVFVVGDGWTDFEIKREGFADFFLAFTENIRRLNVIELADREVNSFNEVIDFLNFAEN